MPNCRFRMQVRAYEMAINTNIAIIVARSRENGLDQTFTCYHEELDDLYAKLTGDGWYDIKVIY